MIPWWLERAAWSSAALAMFAGFGGIIGGIITGVGRAAGVGGVTLVLALCLLGTGIAVHTMPVAERRPRRPRRPGDPLYEEWIAFLESRR